MPFLAGTVVDVPTTDILTWIFEDQQALDWDEPILINALRPEESISLRQAWTIVRRLAVGFRKLGVRQGDCVAVASFNDIFYPVTFLGILAAGGVFTGLSPSHTPDELAYSLRTSRAKLILSQPEILSKITVAARRVGLSSEDIIVFDPRSDIGPSGFRRFPDLLRHGESDWVRFDDLEICSSTTAARMFSSGTTGLPKAADLSHYNLIAQHTLAIETEKVPWKIRRLHALPMFHAATVPVAFTSSFRNSSKAFILPRFDLEQWLWAHDEYQITNLFAVPPIVVQVISHPSIEKYSLRPECSIYSGKECLWYDIAYVDAATKLWYIVDRKKELIKVRAFQVAPGELEGILLDHPDIVDAAVIGIPDASSGGASECPTAYIVRGPHQKSQRLGAEAVHQYMRERLASYKQLTGGIVFTDLIPKNVSGKILKRILREQATRELGARM